MNISRIPGLYRKMDEYGLLKPETYLWLDDMEWLSIKQISEYEYEEGEIKDIVPFAHTARYDKWGILHMIVPR